MDNTNKYMVGVRGKEIVIMLPPMGSISKHDALMMAAWDRKGRPRTDKASIEPKHRYGWGPWPEFDRQVTELEAAE